MAVLTYHRDRGIKDVLFLLGLDEGDAGSIGAAAVNLWLSQGRLGISGCG